MTLVQQQRKIGAQIFIETISTIWSNSVEAWRQTHYGRFTAVESFTFIFESLEAALRGAAEARLSRFRACNAARTMSAGSAIAPSPRSPHSSTCSSVELIHRERLLAEEGHIIEKSTLC